MKWSKKAMKSYITGKETFGENLIEEKQKILTYLGNEFKVEFKKNKTIFRTKNKYILPEKGDKCEFEDFFGNKFVGTFHKLKLNQYPPTYISKEKFKVKNYCHCCAEKEPWIEINEWENLNKVIK